MRRFRNPRYAPESLERKLHPSGLIPAVAAEVASFAPTGSMTITSAPAAGLSALDPPDDPPSDPPPPPLPPPPVPNPTDPWGDPTNPTNPNFSDVLVAA